jgi:hypothetical protein
LRSALASGDTVEVAGYSLNSALAAAIDASVLKLPDTYKGTLLWLETGRMDQTELAPVSAQRVSAFVDAGLSVSARAVPGPSFWQTVEIEEAPALVDATLALLTSKTHVATEAR